MADESKQVKGHSGVHSKMKISILGSGSVGSHLSILLSAAGHDVQVVGRKGIASAVERGDVVVIAIPYNTVAASLAPLAASLKGKIVVDATNPLNSDWSPLLLGQENSAGEEITRLFPESRVVKAFNTIFADVMVVERLNREGQAITAFYCGNDADANAVVADLAKAAGFSPVYCGDITSSRYLEAMAHLNIRLAVALGGGTNAAFLYHQSK